MTSLRSSLSGPSVSSLAPALGVHNHCGLSLQESSGGDLLFLRARFDIILLAFLPSTTGEVFLNSDLSSENKLVPDLSNLFELKPSLLVFTAVRRSYHLTPVL